ncbi:MAG: FMN-binding protein [Planctomycetota bacterium]|jgi:Na+-transporting NADH:ubiquinone oxidoreductase subunit C
MKGSLYTVFYAAALGSVCAGLLTTVGHYTRPFREANKEAERVRNVLGVLEVPYEGTLSAEGLLEVYKENVKERALGDLELFSSMDAQSGEERLVAVGLDGPGVWGPIKGFMALDPDMKTIRGITFHEQEETPGLGAEITTVAFRDKFKGKLLVGPDGKPGLRIKAGASGPTGIDAISGATMTCDKVQDLLNKTIVKIVAERAR